jgi:predicted dehydrogenase
MAGASLFTSVGQWASAAETIRRKAAIIGHTGRGDYGHGLDEIFLDRPELELVAIADADANGLEGAAAKLKPRSRYADYREMLSREKPDLVSVAPRQAGQHRDMVKAALESGAHVFCEKPFTTTPAEADELLQLAARHQLKITVAHQMRLSPAIVHLKQAIGEGLLGELVELRGYGKQDSRAGGEDLMVLGTHIFDLMRLFAGDPVSCTARVLWKGKDITRADARRVKDDIGLVAGDEVTAQFSFARGVTGNFVSRGILRESVGVWGLELIGSKGSVRLNAGIPPGVFVLKSNGWRPEGRSDQWQPFAPDAEAASSSAFRTANARLFDDWVKSIGTANDPICSGRNAAWTIEMVMAIYRAALTSARVTFPLKERGHALA